MTSVTSRVNITIDSSYTDFGQMDKVTDFTLDQPVSHTGRWSVNKVKDFAPHLIWDFLS